MIDPEYEAQVDRLEEEANRIFEAWPVEQCHRQPSPKYDSVHSAATDYGRNRRIVWRLEKIVSSIQERISREGYRASEVERALKVVAIRGDQ